MSGDRYAHTRRVGAAARDPGARGPRARTLRRGVPAALLLLLAVAPGAPPALHAQAVDAWRLGVSVGAQVGDYGTATTTTALYAWLTVRRLFPWGDLHAVLPYTRLSSESGGATTSASGVGDVGLGARYFVYESSDYRTSLAAIGRVKLPTADEQQDLGTGETDATLGLEFTRFVTPRTYVFADLAYTRVGDPPDEPLNDQGRLTAGTGGFVSERVALSAAYERRGSPFPGTPDAEELLLALNRKGTPSVHGAVNYGLSTGAPDYGVTAGITFRF